VSSGAILGQQEGGEDLRPGRSFVIGSQLEDDRAFRIIGVLFVGTNHEVRNKVRQTEETVRQVVAGTEGTVDLELQLWELRKAIVDGRKVGWL